MAAPLSVFVKNQAMSLTRFLVPEIRRFQMKSGDLPGERAKPSDVTNKISCCWHPPVLCFPKDIRRFQMKSGDLPNMMSCSRHPPKLKKTELQNRARIVQAGSGDPPISNEIWRSLADGCKIELGFCRATKSSSFFAGWVRRSADFKWKSGDLLPAAAKSSSDFAGL